MKKWWRSVRPYVLSGPLYWLVRLIGMSLKLRSEGYERYASETRGRIYAGWHGRTFIAATFFRNKGVWTIISLSRDGEMQNRIFTRFGFNTIRGSSGRGGAKALIECIKVLRNGVELAFTPDGPRGPSHKVQDGILHMAQKSGALIVPVGVSASRCWRAPTWDKFLVPKPFAKAIMMFGEPIEVPKGVSPEELAAIGQTLEDAITAIEIEADRRMTGADTIQG